MPHAGPARHRLPDQLAMARHGRILGQNADARRQPASRNDRRPRSGRRPVGHSDRKHALAGRPDARSEARDGTDSRFREESRGDLPRDGRTERNGFRRGSVVESGHAAQGARIYGQKQPARSVAPSGAVHARRHELQALPGAVPAAHSVRQDEIHGNLQRIGGLLRHTERSGVGRPAADARLRRVLRVLAGARFGRSVPGSTARGGRQGDQLRDDHHDLQRPVALPDRRHGRVYVARSVQDPDHRAHAPLYQRLRRGDHRR